MYPCKHAYHNIKISSSNPPPPHNFRQCASPQPFFGFCAIAKRHRYRDAYKNYSLWTAGVISLSLAIGQFLLGSGSSGKFYGDDLATNS
jgi:hypothetical protein